VGYKGTRGGAIQSLEGGQLSVPVKILGPGETPVLTMWVQVRTGIVAAVVRDSEKSGICCRIKGKGETVSIRGGPLTKDEKKRNTRWWLASLL